jgi:hypothetical protein
MKSFLQQASRLSKLSEVLGRKEKGREDSVRSAEEQRVFMECDREGAISA